MRTIYAKPPEPDVPRLALRPREAAVALGVSEKALWSLTSPRGSLPCVRVGSRVTYWAHQLRAWADAQLEKQQRAEAGMEELQ
jgi:predicted DNA-binding transcriptional regulator AlpA